MSGGRAADAASPGSGAPGSGAPGSRGPGSRGPGGGAPWDDGVLREVVLFLPDTARLLRAVLADDRVPRRAKVQAGAALAYLASPLDVLPDALPVVGRLDDALVLGLALRRLVAATGTDVLRDHWDGSERGLEVLLGLVALVGAPGGLLRRVLGGSRLVRAARTPGDRRRGDGPARPGRGRVVDGEVVSEVVEEPER